MTPSIICFELANIRTSTCAPKYLGGKCTKWIRSRFYNDGVTNQIYEKAVTLLDDFNKNVWKNALLSFDDEKSIFDSIVDAEKKLLDSKAVLIDSALIDELRKLKIYFCTHYMLQIYQMEFQKSIGQIDEMTMKNLTNLVRNDELVTAIKIFVRNYEANNIVAEITKFYVASDLSRTGLFLLDPLPYLKFEFTENRKPESTTSSTVVMKIPSLLPIIEKDLVKNICSREALFYDRILPKLYQWGQCQYFAPVAYAITKDNALILEDLAVRGYKHGDLIDQLNWNQIEVSLQFLAKYHALSYKYLQTYGNDALIMSLIRSFPLSILEGGDYFIHAFYRIVQPFLDPTLYNEVKNMETKFLAEHLTKKREEENTRNMNVIIHGDFRISNILFKTSQYGKMMEPMLINWQASRETNPAVELIHFFVTSVPIEIFKTHEKAMKNIYLKKLNEVLVAIKSDRVYERPELDKDIRHYKYYYLRVLAIYRQYLFDSDEREKEEQAYKSSAPKWIEHLKTIGIIDPIPEEE